MRGDPSDSYVKLPSYLFMIKQINQGIIIRLHKTDEENFMYAFVALNSLVKGWKYHRIVMIVDGRFLKTSYIGIFLIASCQKDGGNIATC